LAQTNLCFVIGTASFFIPLPKLAGNDAVAIIGILMIPRKF